MNRLCENQQQCIDVLRVPPQIKRVLLHEQRLFVFTLLSLGQRTSIHCDIYILVKKDTTIDVVSTGVDHYSTADGFIPKVDLLYNINRGNTWHLRVGTYKLEGF